MNVAIHETNTETTPNQQHQPIILSNAGGVGVVLLDLLEQYNLAPQEISPELSDKLKQVLPSASSIHNPVDILGDATSERYTQALTILGEQGVKNIIVVITPQIMTDIQEIMMGIQQVQKNYPESMIYTLLLGERYITNGLEYAYQHNLLAYDQPLDLVSALAHSTTFKVTQMKRANPTPINIAVHKSLDNQKLGAIKKRVTQAYEQGTELTYADIALIADVFSVTMPKQDFLNADKPAQQIIKEYLSQQDEVILKVVTPEIKHRTEHKLVDTHISTLKSAREFITSRREFITNPENDLIIQQKITGGEEVLVGMLLDPHFGSTIIIGSGGIYTEVWKDITYIPCPVDSETVVEQIKGTRIGTVLKGYRNKTFALEKLGEQVERLSRIPQYFPEIESFEINPMIVTQDQAVVVDFKINLHKK
jgi:acyl-CoA synthetase (NDP forming)